MLKSKIHRATITECALEYIGSITLGPEMIKTADLLIGEKVLISNLDNGNRFETYVIQGRENEICLNGAAAHLGSVGDKIIIMHFVILEDSEGLTFTSNSGLIQSVSFLEKDGATISLVINNPRVKNLLFEKIN